MKPVANITTAHIPGVFNRIAPIRGADLRDMAQ